MFRLRSKQNVQLVVNSPIGLAKKYFKIIIIVTGVKLNGHSHKYCGNINGYDILKRYLAIHIEY